MSVTPLPAPAGLADRRERQIAALSEAGGRDLSEGELLAFVGRLAERPELWVDRVEHAPERRHYAELCRGEHLSVWLICWMDGHDTGFHDHDTSAGAVAVVGGRLLELRLTLDGPPRSHAFAAGQSFHFAATDIHRVLHAGGGPAVTLHAYSPPLRRMGAYEVSEGGVLARRALDSTQELRPRPAAA